jgi:hypothetical protein
MPAGAAQVAGIAFTQCAAVATIPGLFCSPACTLSGCHPLTVTKVSGFSAHLDFVAFPGRPE